MKPETKLELACMLLGGLVAAEADSGVARLVGMTMATYGSSGLGRRQRIAWEKRPINNPTHTDRRNYLQTSQAKAIQHDSLASWSPRPRKTRINRPAVTYKP